MNIQDSEQDLVKAQVDSIRAAVEEKASMFEKGKKKLSIIPALYGVGSGWFLSFDKRAVVVSNLSGSGHIQALVGGRSSFSDTGYQKRSAHCEEHTFFAEGGISPVPQIVESIVRFFSGDSFVTSAQEVQGLFAYASSMEATRILVEKRLEEIQAEITRTHISLEEKLIEANWAKAFYGGAS